MASVIATKSNNSSDSSPRRWFHFTRADSERAEIEQILDLYWGGTERRITGLTLRIMAVNVIAILMLFLGVVYLGQYHKDLIEARLETFQREVELIAITFSESAIDENEQDSFSYEQVDSIIQRLDIDFDKELYLFNQDGKLSVKTANTVPYVPDTGFHSLQVLKDMMSLALVWVPDRQVFPSYSYPHPDSKSAVDYPDVLNALEGNSSLSAWQNAEEEVFLSAAVPIMRGDESFGALLMTWDGRELYHELSQVWLGILGIFVVTFIITIVLSIYLSGTIARPLKKLSKAADALRTGQGSVGDIPDFSDRFDEIGDLSIVLRDMTAALWERMDATEQFAADVAHELKNPLTSLRSAVETLPRVKKKQDKERLMEIVYHDLNRLDRLITDISYASRLDTELSRERFKKVDLRSLLHNLLKTYDDPIARPQEIKGWNYQVRSGAMTIEVNSVTDQDLFVWGIEGRLEQVFQNIVSNALSFSPEDGVVAFFIVPLKRRVLVTIENQGPSIPDEKLESIFERFYSERPDHEEYGQHSGLGLSICRQIVEAHGGRIFAENMSDEAGNSTGVRFSVLLNFVPKD